MLYNKYYKIVLYLQETNKYDDIYPSVTYMKNILRLKKLSKQGCDFLPSVR